MNKKLLNQVTKVASGKFSFLYLSEEQSLCRDYLALRDTVQALSKQLKGRIANCCGKWAGKEFCEAYGCGSMKDIVTTLDDALKGIK